ncbi:hypothetical protein J1605_011637 [Eschrichtius robustus]|uniref:Uncharacterized protein n=1 Tax=Eschrichtius robustus TaxID=9764 RepID=A0AB34GM67_ESCRO|nr:hypothetical protein J1605_011637 [Eschrichtius robustus]
MNEVPTNFPVDTVKLRIEKTVVHRIPAEAFYYLVELQYLWLTYNSVASLDTSSFYNLKQLHDALHMVNAQQDGVKGAAASGALAHLGRGEGGVRRRRGEPAASEAGVTLQQPEAFWRQQQQPQRLTPVSGALADRCGSRPSVELV